MTKPNDLIRRGDAAERKRRQNIGDHHAQMMDARAQCVPCRLCGGNAVITDAGLGFGYTIECENAAQFRKPTCLQSGTRISGWAYNVSDLWNRLNAHSVQEPPVPLQGHHVVPTFDSANATDKGPPTSPGVTAGATGMVADYSLNARLHEVGNQIHNIACEHQSNEDMVERLGDLRAEIWAIAAMLPAAPAPVVPAEGLSNRRAYQVGYAAGQAAALRPAPPVGARVIAEKAYLAGFNAAGEGYNGEWPFHDKGISPDTDEGWLIGRDMAIAALLPAGEGE